MNTAMGTIGAATLAHGLLSGIQQTGAKPAYYRSSFSCNYGVGAFLLAGAKLKRMVKR
jgi:hypothetical protein